MKFYNFYCLILLLFLCNCEQKSSILTASENEQIVLEVRQMFDNYHSDIKTDGLEAEFKYLDDSSHFFWVPPGYESALSYDSVKSILLLNSKIIHSIAFSWDTLQVFPLTGILVNYSGIVNGVMTDSSALESEFKILESGTLIKRKDGWKLLSGQSRNLP